METISETYSVWKDHFSFDGRAQGFNIPMDAMAPLGHHYGATPKELVLAALAGCAGMDVVGLLRKAKQFIDHFEIVTHGTALTDSHPRVFKSIHMTLSLEGSIDRASALRAVEKSQTEYCSISAMLSGSVPIFWTLILNGEEIGKGRANFEDFSDVYQTGYEG